jgi:plasmid stabilization system protein ParE
MAKFLIDYHPVARIEAHDAFDWYAERNLEAAERFQRELEYAQADIQNSPAAWPMYLYGTRHYLLEGYPYIVVYRVLDQSVQILAVAHAHRKPGYWVDRLKA